MGKIGMMEPRLCGHTMAALRVADKRHAAMLASGVEENQAAENVAGYLKAWLSKHGEYLPKVDILNISGAIEAYSKVLA